MLFSRYRDRFWRQSVFDGLDLVRRALDESYGAEEQVGLTRAALRWLNHHSLLSPDHGGSCLHDSQQFTLSLSDAIIIGASKLEHLLSNMEACKEGPLDQRMFLFVALNVVSMHNVQVL